MNKSKKQNETILDGIIIFILKVIFIPIAYTLKIFFYFSSTIINLFILIDKKINKSQDKS